MGQNLLRMSRHRNAGGRHRHYAGSPPSLPVPRIPRPTPGAGSPMSIVFALSPPVIHDSNGLPSHPASRKERRRLPVFVSVVLGPGSRSLSQRLGTDSAAYTRIVTAQRETAGIDEPAGEPLPYSSSGAAITRQNRPLLSRKILSGQTRRRSRLGRFQN